MVTLWGFIPICLSVFILQSMVNNHFEFKDRRLALCHQNLSLALEEINHLTQKLESLNPKASALRSRLKQLLVELKLAQIEVKVSPGSGSLRIAYLQLQILKVKQKQMALAGRQKILLSRLEWSVKAHAEKMKTQLIKYYAKKIEEITIPIALQTIEPQSITPSYVRQKNYSHNQMAVAKWQAAAFQSELGIDLLDGLKIEKSSRFSQQCKMTLIDRNKQWSLQLI